MKQGYFTLTGDDSFNGGCWW